MNLTRQFAILNQEEYLQLGLSLYYPPEAFQNIEFFEAWSIHSEDLKAFQTLFEASPGFQAVLSMKPLKVGITLDET